MVKLNVGSFVTMFDDWRNSDILDLRPWAQERGLAFSQWSIEGPIPYDDGVVDLIFSCHVLEHVTYEAGAKFLAECHRAMKPGGVLRILVPGAEALTRAYIDGKIGPLVDEWLAPEMKGAPAPAKLWEVMCANHRALYDFPTLYRALWDAGFKQAARAEFGVSRSPVMQAETKDLYPGLSLIVEAVR